MKRLLASLAIALFCGCGLSGVVFADTLKTVHIKLPPNPGTGPAADDMHVTFFGPVTSGPKGTQPGNTSDPSDTFDGVSGVGTNTLNFAGGSLGPGNTDNFHVGIKGDPNGVPTASNIITKVEFTQTDPRNPNGPGIVYKTLQPGNAAQTKEFKKYVTGFTNDEAFSFADLADSHLFLFNTDASLNLRYRLQDFKVYKDLPLSNFSIDSFQTASASNLVFSAAELVIEPGETADISLGTVLLQTYALATVGTITVEDLTDGTSQTYSIPQGYAQTTPVPEPETWALLSLGLLAAVVRVRRKPGVCKK